MSQREADRPTPLVLHPVRRSIAARSAGRALRDLRDVRDEDLHRRVRPLAPTEEPWLDVLVNLCWLFLAALIFVAITARG